MRLLALFHLAVVATLGGRSAPTGAPAPRLVAEAPIWGANAGAKGYAFLPVTIHGHAGTLVINLNCTRCNVALSTAALTRLGVPLADPAATTLDTLVIGSDTQRDVPLAIIAKPTWHVPGPDALPPVVGTVGVQFLTTHYDILYDFPHRRVQLYALPSKPVSPQEAWLPPGFKPTDCGKMVSVPPGAGTFTGMMMQIDGHPVTGVFEMTPESEKMNHAAMRAMGLTDTSARVQAFPPGSLGNLPPIAYEQLKFLANVHLTVGRNTFWTGQITIFPWLEAEKLIKEGTPVMLMNLHTIRDVRLFNATSSSQVCVAKS
jgi:hypothetical protein